MHVVDNNDIIELRPGVLKNTKTGDLYFNCMDCGFPHPTSFMVKHKVWMEAGFVNMHDGNICISCFEKRLGRTLKAEDLADVPLNTLVW